MVLTVFLIALLNKWWRHENLLEIKNIKTLGLAAYYLTVKSIPWSGRQVRFYYGTFSFFALALVVYGLLETNGWIETGHLYWPLTGNFSNPGPFAGFIAVLFPVIVWHIPTYFKGKKVYGTGLLILVLLMVYVVWLTGSRAALLSMVVSVVMMIGFVPGTVFSKHRILSFLSAVILAFVLGTAFLHKGIESIEGRIFIWKVTFRMVKDYSIWGIGHDNFKNEYIEFQTDYFEGGGACEEEILVAGNTQFVFNEPLKLLAENGLIGFLLVTGLAILLFLKSKVYLQSKEGLYTVLVLAALLLFAQFSYPLSFLCFKLILINAIAILSVHCQTNIDVKLGRWGKAILLLLLLVIAVIGGLQLADAHRWKRAYLLQYENPDKSQQLFTTATNSFSDNPHFLYMYGLFLRDRDLESSTALFEESAQHYASYQVFHQLAENYEKLEKNKKAKGAYLRAHFSMPVLLGPQLDLMEFYIRMEDQTEALVWANKILETPIKIDNYKARSIKKKAKNYIEDNCF